MNKMMMKRVSAYFAIVLLAALTAQAEVQLSGVFTDHMVLQRDRPVPVYGTASPGEAVTVTLGGKTVSTKANMAGRWLVNLPPMTVNATGQSMTVTGTNTIALKDVLLGDVWICSGQSNMEMVLSACKRPQDVASANFPGIRHFTSTRSKADEPSQELPSSRKWVVCTPTAAPRFTAAGFYFARKLQQELKSEVPIGLILASVGGTRIELWLAKEGLGDIPALHPLLKHRPYTDHTSSFFNGCVAPLAPYAARGVLWYQGENSELNVQSPYSYYLKMKALIQGWKRVWGQDDLAFYFVMIANYGKLQPTVEPVLISGGGWDADTRLQQVKAMALPHSGCASAMDIGVSKESWGGYHPENKQDVGERLALWALKNEYGRSSLVTSGPVLRNVAVAGNTVVCNFDHLGGGLMVGLKKWYEPTEEVPDGQLQRFSIAGADGKWHVAEAVIKGDTVVLSSPDVAAPHKVSYACWQNPEGANLYNKGGLPAAPFHVEDVTKQHSIAASAGSGGTISPAGSESYLPADTALYTITPEAGHYVQDVKVDGVSVGSVRHYTFDPLQGNHTIAATFTKTAPSYALTVAAGGGGRVTPSGKAAATQGESVSFSIVPEPGNRAVVTVDGVLMGPRDRVTFDNIRASHALDVSFVCTIAASAGYGGNITPGGTQVMTRGENASYKITPLPGYSIAGVTVDGKDAGKLDTHTFTNVTASHRIAATFRSDSILSGSIPRPEQLIFAGLAKQLPAPGKCTGWPAYAPKGKQFAALGEPSVKTIDGKKYADTRTAYAQRFHVGSYNEAIPCKGASIVVVARPERSALNGGGGSLVNVFYNRLSVGIKNENGEFFVQSNGGAGKAKRNDDVETLKAGAPDGQITILSLIVQPDGSYVLYANGQKAQSGHSGYPMDQLVPGVAGGYAKAITIGCNGPDGYTTFNGQIGDVFLYKTALSEVERKQLEAFIAKGLL